MNVSTKAMDKSAFTGAVLSKLRRRYGSSLHTELVNRNIVELFVAVFLSPQCTDKQTNRATVKLFEKYRTFGDYADSDLRTLMRLLSGLNYYKTKARNLKRSASIIVNRFNGKVPRTLSELMELPGVGRKVANVILNEGFGINEGIAVDTHCAVVARRLGLSRKKDPAMIEDDLKRKFRTKDWGSVSNLFIALGRDTCTARTKRCEDCVLRNLCPSSTAE